MPETQDNRVDAWVRRLRRAPLIPLGEGSIPAPEDCIPSRLLPHRPPMLLLDSVEAVDPAGGRLRARRRVMEDDPVLAGHFPGQPVYPGVLLVEMMAQAALAVLPFAEVGGLIPSPDWRPADVRFTRIRTALFLAPVLPGVTLEVHAEASDDGLMVLALGQVYGAGVLCACAVSEAHLVH